MSYCSSPMVCSLPGSSVHGIFQVRVLEWVAKRTGKPGVLQLMGWQRVGYVLGNEQQLFAAGTKYHKRSGPEQKKCIVSPLWRLKV